MVFSSLPPYHHHEPSNWQQQQLINGPSGSGINNSTVITDHVPPPPPPPPPPPSIRPGSMADRARMANIPMPEAALKCPRCDSTNTKFCYFNNYSLTQPRHFCKTCRRYWTRGGALRTVPVGGGFRRNKRSKSNSKPSSSSSSSSSAAVATSSSSAPVPGGPTAAEILGLPPMLPLQHRHHLLPPDHYPYEMAGGGVGLYGSGLESMAGYNMMAEHWRMPAPPPLPQYLFPATSSGITQQMASVKMEDSSSSRQRLLLESNNNNNNNNNIITEQLLYWNNIGGGGASSSATATASSWTDLSGFSSSSAPTNNNQHL